MNRKGDKGNFRETDISGKWRVAEVPDLADDYLELSPDPHVMLKLRGRGEVDGAYEFGAQSGTIDGRFERLANGRVRLSFTFEGNDELDPVHGYGEAILTDENIMKGRLRYILLESTDPTAKPTIRGDNIVKRYQLAAPREYILYRPELLYNPLFPELFENPKIVVRKIAGRRGIMAALDEKLLLL